MNDVELAYRIRQALNEGAERLDYRITMRLEKARRAALARQKAPADAPAWIPSLRLAPNAGPMLPDEPASAWTWLRRVGVLVPVLALAIGFVGISRWHEDQDIAERANLDLAVLLDDTPIDTYADRGFGEMMRVEQGM
jgi:hypothetical protein